MLQPGQLLQNRYRVISLLGQGGMGAVYRAWDTRLNVAVALKEMLSQPGAELAMLERLREQFYQEATVLARLSHPHLVRVTDFFLEGPNAYLVMDFVQGESLDLIIKREGAITEPQVLLWAEQLLDALEYCHEQGIIHRDIKPQNVIIRPDSRAMLVDFGLVKMWNPTDPRTQTVMRGLGTPEYAPPEQYDAQAGHTDPRSDIYSLGATLYHALTGQAPPTATQRIARRAAFQPPRLLNQQISSTTDAAILQALELTVEYRFSSATAMAQALRRRPPSAQPQASVVPPAPASFQRSPIPTSPSGLVSYPPPPTPAPRPQGLSPQGIQNSYPVPGAPTTPYGTQPPGGSNYGQSAYPSAGGAHMPFAPPSGGEPTSATIARRKKGLYGWLMGVIFMLIVGLGLVYAGTEGTGPLAQFFVAATIQISPTKEIAMIAEATATLTAVPPSPTVAPKQPTATPTRTPLPTSTSRPTDTPTPTAKPTIAPTPTPRLATATPAPPTATTAPARPGILLDFDRDLDWRRGDEPYGTLARSSEQVRSGSSGKLEYDFPAVERNYVVFRANPAVSMGGQPAGVTVWVLGDGSGHFLNVWIKDSAGELRQYAFGRVSHQGWRQMTARFDDSAGWPNGPISGTNNGKLDFPVQFYAFVLDGIPDGAASRGAIFLDDLGVFYD